MKNKYRIVDNVVVILLRYKGRRFFTHVSLESLPKLMEFGGTWGVKLFGTFKSHYYVYTNRSSGTHRLHRFVMDAPADMVVDHIDRNTLRNTLDNLKIVTQLENMQNKSVFKNSRSGVTGVSWNTRCNAWHVHYKKKYIGSKKDLQEAIQLRKDAESKEEAYYEEA